MKFPAFSAQHPSLFLVLLATLMTPFAHAVTITANPAATDEAVDSDGLCSLREAVLAVDTQSNQTGCVNVTDDKAGTEPYGTNDTIILPAGTYLLKVAGLDEAVQGASPPFTVTNTPDATKGDLDLEHSVKIIGAGSAFTKIEWDPPATPADRIFHIYTDNANTQDDDVVIQGVTLAYGKTTESFLGTFGAGTAADPALDYYFRRAGGALALGAGANVVAIDPTLSGAENANAGGLGGSTGGESGATSYTLTLNGVVVENSIAQGDGGGLYLAAPTTATNLVVRDNKSTTNGGGIYNEANTSISQATFSGNIAEGGGGLFTTGSNIVKIKQSTFSANRAIGGGAISNRKGVTIELENSTLSGNIARDVGAGLYTNGSVFLDFVTVADNLSGADSPSSGSGINPFPAGSGAVMTLKNVLLSGNKKGLPYDPLDPTTDPTSDTFALPDATYIASLPPSNCGTTSGGSGITVASLGHNISGDVTCYSAATVLWFGDTSDINNVDPMIGPLASNGGLTLTHALLSGSPAIGAGAASAGITVDQRGVTRDTPPDIGAYELPASASTGGGGSSGGCVYDPNGASDWTLLILLAAGIGGLLIRHRRKDATKQ